MGYDVYSSASFTIPGTPEGQEKLRRTAKTALELPNCPLDLSEPEDHHDAVLIVGTALMEALGVTDGTCAEGRVDLSADETDTVLWASGEGRHDDDDVKRLLGVFAAEGIDGEIICEGEDYSRWRWRVADGEVHNDDGTTVYDTDPVWIVQMQSVDDHDLDHIAVTQDRRKSTAILAEWAKQDAAKLAASGVSAANAFNPDVSDEDILVQWADIGGVTWDVYQRPLLSVF